MIETAELTCPPELEARAVHLDCGNPDCGDCPWIIFLTEADEDQWTIHNGGVYDFKPETIAMGADMLDKAIRKSIVFGRTWEQVLEDPYRMAMGQGVELKAAPREAFEKAMTMPLARLRELAAVADRLTEDATEGELLRGAILSELPGPSRN